MNKLVLPKVNRLVLPEGREEGREELKIEIAKSLLLKGNAIADVAEITGLSSEQLKALEAEVGSTRH